MKPQGRFTAATKENEFLFVVNWVTTDFEKLASKIPPGTLPDTSWYWAYTGIAYSNMTNKPAGNEWDRYYAMKHLP